MEPLLTDQNRKYQQDLNGDYVRTNNQSYQINNTKLNHYKIHLLINRRLCFKLIINLT